MLVIFDNVLIGKFSKNCFGIREDKTENLKIFGFFLLRFLQKSLNLSSVKKY